MTSIACHKWSDKELWGEHEWNKRIKSVSIDSSKLPRSGLVRLPSLANCVLCPFFISIKGTRTVTPSLELWQKPDVAACPAHGHEAQDCHKGLSSSWLASAQTKKARLRTTTSSGLVPACPDTVFTCSLMIGSHNFSAERRIPMLMTLKASAVKETR